MQVASPVASWNVVSNSVENRNASLEEDKDYLSQNELTDLVADMPAETRIHHFNQTPPIGTYLTCLMVGAYQIYEKTDMSRCKVPMRAFARKTYGDHIQK